jgi:copper transport protein
MAALHVGTHQVRSGRRRIAAIALCLLLVPCVARAHGHVKSTSPAAGTHLALAPREIRLEFSEVPDLTFSNVKLVTADGRAVALAPLAYSDASRRVVVAAIRSALASGTYVVEWQLTGDDGHPTRGRFNFVIAPGAMVMPGAATDSARGRASAPAAAGTGSEHMQMHHDPTSLPEGAEFGVESPAYVVIRWAQYLALLVTIGAVAFRLFVLQRSRPQAQAGSDAVFDEAERRAAMLGLVGVGVGVLTLASRLYAQSYAMHGASDAGDASSTLQMIGSTMWGRGWVLNLIGLLVSGAGLTMALRAEPGPRAPGDEGARVAGPLRPWSVATLGVVLLAFFPALSGHAAASPSFPGLAIVADALHVLGASSWLGTLTVLLVAGLPAAIQRGESRRGAIVADLANAFSPAALVSASLAAVTGVFAAWLHIGRIPDLWGSRYGQTLLVKLAILVVVAVTGAYNWRFVKPALGSDAATTRLRRSASVEVTVAVVVLLVTAILVALPTPVDEMESAIDHSSRPSPWADSADQSRSLGRQGISQQATSAKADARAGSSGV